MDSSDDSSDSFEEERKLNLAPDKLKELMEIVTIDGKSLFHMAVERGHEEIVQWLTKRDEDGNTALHLAIKHNQTEIFNILVRECNLNTENLKNERPLHYAVAYNRVEFVKTLVKNFAIVHVKDCKKQTPFHIALKQQNFELVKILYDYGATVSSDGCPHYGPLDAAVEYGNLESVKLIIMNSRKSSFDSEYCNGPLLTAVKWGHFEIVKFLMEHDPKGEIITRRFDYELLDACIEKDQLNIFKYLVDVGVKTERDILNDTIISKRRKILMYLLTCMSKVYPKTYYNQSKINLAIRMGNVEIVKMILDEQSIIDTDSFASKLAVQIAVENGNEEILQILLNAGYSVEGCFEEIKPLHVAATFEHTGLAKMLLKFGADVNSKTEKLYTPLHFAACAGHPSMVKFLLENGAETYNNCPFTHEPLTLALHMFSPSLDYTSINASTFQKLIKITKLLIPTESTYYVSMSSAIKLRVSTDESSSNLESNYDSFVEDIKKSTFRLEIIECIFNSLSDEYIKYISEAVINNNYGLKHIPETLLYLMMEYNDSTSCYDVKLNHYETDYNCKLLVISYSKNVDNLLGVYYDKTPRLMPRRTKAGYATDINILRMRLARVVLLTKSVSNPDVSLYCLKYNLNDWRDQCEKELNIMSETKVIDKLNVTFSDILTQPIDKIAIYVNSENFVKAIETSYVKFPAYAEFLRINVERGVRRNNFIDECVNLMYGLVKRDYKIRISNVDIDQVFQYLSILDLRRFSAACSA